MGLAAAFSAQLLLLLALPASGGGPAAGPARLVIDDFGEDAPGAFPAGWELKADLLNPCRGKKKSFAVKAGPEGRYLAVESAGDACTAARRFPFDLSVYRVLSWRWRARVLPKGGDERTKAADDSAAGLYVCFKGFALLPYCIKYVWSAALPPGTVLASPFRKATKVVVLESGSAKLGTWVEEKRDLYEDYLKVFGGRAVKNPAGVALLTDSDNTRSSAAADYAGIAVSKD